MKTAFIIFDQMTALDLIGVYDPLTRLKSMNFVPEFNWQICAYTEEVSDDRGLRFTPDTVAVSLSEYDMIVVPEPGSVESRSKPLHDGCPPCSCVPLGRCSGSILGPWCL